MSTTSHAAGPPGTAPRPAASEYTGRRAAKEW